jgi:sRNA-binding regulator protein Hfq
MANPSRIPALSTHASKSAAREELAGTLRPLDPPSAQESQEHGSRKVEDIDVNYSGPRKLVRPVMPDGSSLNHTSRRRGVSTLLAHHELAPPPVYAADGSHAEAFYFQKQIQTQTLMVFVLEDGEQIEGYIEWYDRNVVKVRHRSRTLIYKSSIKYLYKASENQVTI